MTEPAAGDEEVAGAHAGEPHSGSITGRLNWLRAGVLGANDGIISTAGLVIGVAAATSGRTEIATAGVAGLVAGAVSMALGEYVSVSSQRDTERALIARERHELATMPEAELEELIGLLRQRGLSEASATTTARELTERDALRAHLSFELGIESGAAAPLAAILLSPASVRVNLTFVVVLVALVATGWLSAYLGDAPRRAAVLRLVIGGGLAMAITFGIGYLFGAAIA